MRDSRQLVRMDSVSNDMLPVPNASSRSAYVQQSHLFCKVSKDDLGSPNDGESVLICVIFKLELIITDTILNQIRIVLNLKNALFTLG